MKPAYGPRKPMYSNDGPPVQMTVVLTEDLEKRLQDEHERTGAPLAEIIRRALKAYLP